MSLESEFRKAAQDLIAEFSIGTYKLRKPTSVYNTTTGAVSITNADTSANMVQAEITFKEIADVSYTKDHIKVVVAGLDIDPVEPTITDQIVTPSGTVHEIVKVKTDQYKAAYIMHVKRGQ